MRNIGLIAAAAIATLLGARAVAAEPPAKTIGHLMAEDLQPAAEIYWSAVQFIGDEPGDQDIAPETDADWQRTRDAATRIGKLGVVLQASAYAEGRGDDWTELARSLVRVSKIAEKAADARNADRVFEVGGTIYSVCSACHQAYPPTPLPAGI